MNNIFSYTLEDLEEYFLNNGEKKFKSKQVYNWLYKKSVYEFDNFSDMKKDLIEKLKKDFSNEFIEIKKVEKDRDTSKYLFKLKGNELIEAVLMKHDYGNSVCISSQVGCNMGCLFCESGRRKKVRNLEVYEMVEQILLIENEMQNKINSVVIMGIGEPFDNYDNVIKFIKIINSDFGLMIGARHITVSTCGIVPKIKEFSALGLQVNLALSLHGPDDETRNKLMPINKVYNVCQVIEAIKEYIAITNRRVTIEYVMINNVNDSLECAKKLVNLIRGMNVYVNLIPYNETTNIEYRRSSDKSMKEFYNYLVNAKINVTVRREFGRNISAACGQLRSKEEKNC